MGFVTKMIHWVMVFLAGNIGIIQAVIKFVKEVLTLAVDILFPVIPIAKFHSVVMAIRNAVKFLTAGQKSSRSGLFREVHNVAVAHVFWRVGG